jgi:hypothetical protein
MSFENTARMTARRLSMRVPFRKNLHELYEPPEIVGGNV